MYRLFFLFFALIVNFQSAFCQDSIQRIELKPVEISDQRPNPHVLTNYHNGFNLNNEWTVSNRLLSNIDTNGNICLLSKVLIPNNIYINNVSFKIPHVDTITHALRCIIIQDDSIISKKDILPESKLFNKQVHISFAKSLVVKKGVFYIGIELVDKCNNCTFYQKFIPNHGENNFIGIMPKGATLKEYNTSNLIKIEEGIQYKIGYN